MDRNKAHRLGIVLQEYPKLTEGFVIRSVQLLEQMGYNLRVYSVHHPHDRFFLAPDLDRLRMRTRYLPPLPLLAFPALWGGLKLLFTYPAGLGRGLSLFLRLLYQTAHPLHTIVDFLYALHLGANHLRPGGINYLTCFGSGRNSGQGTMAAAFSGAEFNFSAAAGDLFTQPPRELLIKVNMASFVVVKSKYDRQYLRSLDGLKSRVYVFYPGIDLEEYEFPRRLKMPQPPYQLLSVGGLNAKNNLPLILKAVAILKARGLDLQYVIVGDNHGASAFLRLAAELGVADTIRFTGMIGPERLLAEFRRSHLLLAGSRITASGDRHDWPDAVVEAMAMGVPVVAENNGAIGELLENEETGMLVEPDRPEAFADACQLMLEDDISREMVIFKARLKIEGNFSHGRLIADFVDILEENDIYV